MLMTLAFGFDALATSAARSITSVLETRPDRMMASALIATWIVSAGKS